MYGAVGAVEARGKHCKCDMVGGFGRCNLSCGDAVRGAVGVEKDV